jgi:hypothetical protein
MTHRAPLPQGFVLKNKRPRLLPMTLSAILIQPRHCQAARRFENIAPVRIVALNAIHVTFNDRMMLRHPKFSLRLQMTLETSGWIFARVHNKFAAPTARFDMFAARPVARFATRLPAELCIIDMHTGMRTGRKYSGDIRVTLRTGAITDVSCSCNFQRRNYRPSQGRTGYCDEHNQEQCADSRRHTPKSR